MYKLATLAAVLGLGLATAPAAHAAATVSSDGNTTVLTDSSGEIVSIQVDPVGCTVDGEEAVCHQFTASSGTVEADESSSCVERGATSALCVPAPQLEADLGDGNDTLRIARELDYETFVVDGGPGEDSIDGGSKPVQVDGGPGDDAIYGSAADDELGGGDGADRIQGGDGDDHIDGQGGNDRGLLGNAGDDVVEGGDGDDANLGWYDSHGASEDPGADRYSGGAGRDTLHYDGDESWSEGVSVSLDGQPNDGHPSEGDDVAGDIEELVGTNAGDHLSGDANANDLRGLNGPDTLVGGGGSDRLHGDQGADTLQGGAGDDTLEGGRDDDTVDGGAGADSAYGDDAACCDFGNDTLLLDDGEADRANCGPGSDRVAADWLDVLPSEGGFGGCESVTRRAGGGQTPSGGRPPGEGGGAANPATGFTVSVPRRLRASARRVKARVRCAAACTVDGTLSLRSRRLGHDRVVIAGAGEGTLTVRIGRRVAGLRRRLVLRVHARFADGHTEALARTIRVKR